MKRHGRDLEANSGQDQSRCDQYGRVCPLPGLGEQKFGEFRRASPGVEPGDAHHQKSGGESAHDQQFDAGLQAGRFRPVKRRQEIQGDADQLQGDENGEKVTR